MKKGIPIALLAAGLIPACQATKLNHPVDVLGAAPLRDTVFYYDEFGDLLRCKTDVDFSATYVIRTCSTKADIYKKWNNRDQKTSSQNYAPADVKNISWDTAGIVARCIKRGNLTDSVVIKNTVKILDKQMIVKLYDTIMQVRKKYSGDIDDYREYGGIVRADGTITFHIGAKALPSSSDDPELELNKNDTGAVAFYHSHPSGEEDKERTTHSYVQGPSLRDQQRVDDKISYVFALHDSCRRIYIFDSTGVLATLPIEYWKSKCNKKSLSDSYKNIKK